MHPCNFPELSPKIRECDMWPVRVQLRAPSLLLSPCHHIRTNPSKRLSSRAATARRRSGCCWRSCQCAECATPPQRTGSMSAS